MAEAGGPAEPDDDHLLRRVAEGDGAAFGLLAERLGPIIKRVLYRLGLGPSDVEDAAQETLVRIWRGSASFRGGSSVSTWACRVAINQGITLLRKAKRAPLAEEEPEIEDPEAGWEGRHRAQVVRRAVVSLPLPLRSVIVLREFEDLSYREIADALEIPIGTVMSRLHEARSRLRRQLDARM